MSWQADDARTPTTLEKQLLDAIAAESRWLDQHRGKARSGSALRLIGQHEGFRHALTCVLDYFVGKRNSIVCDTGQIANSQSDQSSDT
jgi:hypothetical protein